MMQAGQDTVDYTVHVASWPRSGLTVDADAAEARALPGSSVTATFTIDYGRFEAPRAISGRPARPGPMTITIIGEKVQAVVIDGRAIAVKGEIVRGFGSFTFRLSEAVVRGGMVLTVRFAAKPTGMATVKVAAELPKLSVAGEATATRTFRQYLFAYEDSRTIGRGTLVTGKGTVNGTGVGRRMTVEAAAGIDLRNTTLTLETTTGNAQDEQASLVNVQLAADGRSWTFTLVGEVATAATTPGGQIPNPTRQVVLRDKATNAILLTAPVVVVIPAAISAVHPQMDHVVTGVNRLLSLETSPVFVDELRPNNHFSKVTIYVHYLPILVVDQFGMPLDAVYSGAGVEEMKGGQNWVDINQPLRADGTYLDPVGSYSVLTKNRYVSADDTEGKMAWLQARPLPAIEKPAIQEYNIRIAGHILDTGIVNRTVTITPVDGSSAKVSIVWP